MTAPEDIARQLIDGIRYMVLGTIDADGRPRTSPVYFSPDGYHLLYWISSPDAVHSRNVVERPDVTVVVFDSTVPIGTAEAVYMTARAEQVPDDELDACVEVACRARFPEQKVFPADQLRPPGPFRLWRARVSEHSVLIRGSDPLRGRGVDRRLVVQLSP
jgi:nitroimidazol reductase NimA-like FMN-containing flavoprotein (pyridoxamine 5'-phosphate oxidase superfamily)